MIDLEAIKASIAKYRRNAGQCGLPETAMENSFVGTMEALVAEVERLRARVAELEAAHG